MICSRSVVLLNGIQNAVYIFKLVAFNDFDYLLHIFDIVVLRHSMQQNVNV